MSLCYGSSPHLFSQYWQGLRLVVNSFIRAMPAVLDVLLVMLLFMVIFGILGVHLFMGRFGSCSDPTILTRLNCNGTFTCEDESCRGELRERVWANPAVGNFDNLAYAVLTLFEMTTLEMWPQVMYQGIDAYRPDEAPRRDSRMVASVFFIVWILVGSLFIKNLVVGAVADNFVRNSEEEQEEGGALLTSDQKEWVRTITHSVRLKPLRTMQHASVWRQQLLNVVNSQHFEARG